MYSSNKNRFWREKERDQFPPIYDQSEKAKFRKPLAPHFHQTISLPTGHGVVGANSNNGLFTYATPECADLDVSGEVCSCEKAGAGVCSCASVSFADTVPMCREDFASDPLCFIFQDTY